MPTLITPKRDHGWQTTEKVTAAQVRLLPRFKGREVGMAVYRLTPEAEYETDTKGACREWSQAQVDACAEFYRGGYDHPVDEVTAAALIAAGYTVV